MNKVEALKQLEKLFQQSEKDTDALAAYYSLKEFILNNPQGKKEVVLLRRTE